MGAGKLPSFDTPLTAGPITNGPITTGPVSTQSSVGTDLPVQTPIETIDAITPLRTSGTSNLTSAPSGADPRSLGEKKPASVIGSASTTGDTTTRAADGVKKTNV